MSPPPLADGKASLDPLRSVQFSSVCTRLIQPCMHYQHFVSVQFL